MSQQTYIVVRVTENMDLVESRFTDEKKARAFMAKREEKALLIIVLGGSDTIVEVEDHT